MAGWQKVGDKDSSLVDLSGLAALLGPVLSVMQTTADAAQAIADPITDILGIVLSGDPIAGVISAAGAQVINLVEDLINADIYALPLIPTTPRALLRPYTSDAALLDFNSSLLDALDSQRPVFSNTSAWASITLMFGANNWADFQSLLTLMSKVFDGSELGKWKALADLRFNFENFERLPTGGRNTQGAPWDWSRTNYADMIPGLSQFFKNFAEFAQAVNSSAQGIAAGIRKAIAMLARRIAFIQQLLLSIANIAQFLADLEELKGDLFYLYVGSDVGGTVSYANQVLNSSNKPDFKLVGGLALSTFGPNPFASIDLLANILGLDIKRGELIQDAVS